jgi:deoxycytidylate deaminase/dephospho-CoA kinase
MAVAPQPALVIGLTGPIGSGASTVARILETKGFRCKTLSEPIKAEFRKRKGLDPSANVKAVQDWRKALQDIGDEGRDVQRSGRISRWIEEAVNAVEGEQPLVIDGFRNIGEVEWMRNRFTRSFLIAVVADRGVRWDRTKADYDQREDVFEQADKRDSEDKDDLPQGQQVERCVMTADFVLVNNEELVPKERRYQTIWNGLQEPIELMRGTKRENPKEHESHMAQAYALASRSRCLKRHVGAVIVDREGLPLSSGFNENPVGMKPCLLEFDNTCYKDNLMHTSLEAFQNFYCPGCGTRIPSISKPWKCPACGEDIKRKFFPSRNMEYCTALHAEERAIRSLHGRDAVGGTMYVTTFPCMQCARYIVDAGIKKIVYVEAYPIRESRDYLERNEVQIVPFSGFKARAFHVIFRQVD